AQGGVGAVRIEPESLLEVAQSRLERADGQVLFPAGAVQSSLLLVLWFGIQGPAIIVDSGRVLAELRISPPALPIDLRRGGASLSQVGGEGFGCRPVAVQVR